MLNRAVDKSAPIDIQSVYTELKRLAAHYLSQERSGHTLQPTALVNEAWMRFAVAGASAQNKTHYMALAAKVMKDVLIDHARKKLADKRGGPKSMITLDESTAGAEEEAIELLELCDSLDKLKEIDERQARLVELRVFAGMGFEEAASVLDISLATAKRDWLLARAWLYRELA
jgi:RNA polymerase sigma factor (TIGR02999 family)